MCGIAGLLNCRGKGQDDRDNREDMQRMRDRMLHRGPDGGGTWVSPDGLCTLGHQRLSILDLSLNGAQPMVSHSGRTVITYNGEIYNYGEVRKRLETDARARGISMEFRSTCDTEVLQEAIEFYGIGEALKLCKGMFALGIYDVRARTLTLARDRIGEKPLYYGWIRTGGKTCSTMGRPYADSAHDHAGSPYYGEERNAAGGQGGSELYAERFVFASDLGSIRAVEGFANPINRDVLDLYFEHGVIPAPYTIYEGIYKLIPGRILTVRAPFGRKDISEESYWDITEVAVRGQKNLFQGSREEAADELEKLLRQSIRSQMVADVPLGAFLSAGIDSSTIVALMQQESSRRVRTFTIGMENSDYNEAAIAKEIAAYLGTDHTEMYITEQDAKNVIPLLPRMFAEPFADSSQIPTYLVSKMTREHVTVSLSGDAGDELFCGYYDSPATARKWGKIRGIPYWIRKPAGYMLEHGMEKKDLLRIKGQILQARSPEEVYRLSFETDPIIQRIALHPRENSAGEVRVNEGVNVPVWELLFAHGSEECFGVDKEETGEGVRELPYAYTATGRDVTGEVCHDVMLMDMRMYHPDDILVKVDRTAMAVSLETRVPFLDRDVVEFAWTLPIGYLRDLSVGDDQAAAGNAGKLVLRDVLYRYVPKELMNRPKKGFSIPIRQWLKTSELRDWAEDLIRPDKLRQQGLLDPDVVQRIWRDFIDRDIWRVQIWYILMFQAWYEGEYRG